MVHPGLPGRLSARAASFLTLGLLLTAAASAQSVPAPVPATTSPALPAYNSQQADPLEKPITVPAGPAVPPPVQVTGTSPALPAYDLTVDTDHDRLGSSYIPVDSWIYPAALRLYSLGYLDTAFINMRPWTRRSLLHMLQDSQAAIMADGNDQAISILAKLNGYVAAEDSGPGKRGGVYGINTLYTRLLGDGGLPLRDSYHLGQTFVNDYGRPYEKGFNNITGFSTLSEAGPFSLYVRGEYQHAPSATGYTQALTAQLSVIDTVPYPGTNNYNLNQATIPTGPIAAQNPFRLQEAVLSAHLFGHEISGGKSDAWLGPGQGGAMAWSNNAEDIYSFRIDRVEPLTIPFVSRILGPLRYDFFVGSLKGHTDPNEPWVHSEMFSFAPTSNFQFAFQRAVIWGGKGHEAITLHTFFRSFFSFDDTESDPLSKVTNQDPGARYSDFSFSWRLPFLRKYVTLYTDSIAHDDVTPPSAPRRAAYRPGLFLSQVPGARKFDLRVEASSTDTSTLRSIGGQFNYFEGIQTQGYTNKGFIMGDWIGREAKGGNAWLTYHLSGNEYIQLSYLNKKTPKDFIPGGTTQNQLKLEAMKRFRRDIEVDAWIQYEGWKAPIYIPGNGLQQDTSAAVQVTWYPKLRTTALPFSH